MRLNPPPLRRPGPLRVLLLPLLAAAFSVNASAGQVTTPVFELTSGVFANAYEFTIDGSPATVDGDIDSMGITWLGVLLQLTGTTNTALDPTPDDGFHFSGLSAGDYTLTFLGAGTGQYGGHFTVTTPDVTPVPEPSSLPLLLSGLGMLAWGVRRRHGRQP